MFASFERICTIVWIVLLFLTIISGVISERIFMPSDLSRGTAAVILLSIAFLKIRLIIIHFMEIGHAALPLRILLEVWVFATFSILLFLYFTPLQPNA